jgi:TolB-like protein/Flp pilus assembly protein TadD
VTDLSMAVFLSYASQDAEAANRICEALRAAGIEVWFDQSELRGGDVWDQKIRREIRECALFIPIISANTQARTEGYFRLEWRLADQRTHLMGKSRAFLVPVCIDDTGDGNADVPDSFAAVQWTRLPGGATPAAFVEHVRRLLSGDLSKGPTSTGSGAARVSAAPTQQRVRASWRSKAALVLSIAVVVAALGYLVANRLTHSKQVAQPGVPPGTATQAAPASAFNPPPHSIAVLPFVNMSGDATQDYFSDGISEELLNALSRLNDLQVVARTSSFSYKGQNVDVSTIAHKLNVGAVLEGSVRRARNTVRITAQLINTVTGFHLWSETYDRPLNDIFKVQTEVATAVAQQLEIKLAGDSTKFAVGGTRNPDAFDVYLRAQRLYEEGPADTAGWRAVLAALDKAIALDPNYADAYTRRAGALLNLTLISSADAAKTQRERAVVAAERAVALAPDSGDAHAVLGRVRFDVYLDFVGAAAEFDRALALAPGSAYVQRNVAVYTVYLGHFEPALKAAQRAVDLDPQNFYSYRQQGLTFYDARQYSEALAAFRHAQALQPGSPELNHYLAFTFFMLGQTEQARQLCEATATPMHDDDRHWCLALVYHALGRQADAEHEFDRYKKLDADGQSVMCAEIYAQWGNAPAALQWLTKAERLHDWLLVLLKIDPLLDPIRNEPQFKALLARMKFPP